MGRHRKYDKENDSDSADSWPPNDPDENRGLKPQLGKKSDPGEGIADSSLSPIDTW